MEMEKFVTELKQIISFKNTTASGDIVLIAGGTGITPFISFLEYSAETGINNNIKLY